MQTIYVEKNLRNQPRVEKIIQRCGKDALVIECEHYGEIFNRRNQNFRIQKQKPALILAQKNGRLVLPTPEGYSIGGRLNYYFSHMLNCLYDCRYCFLQGMYPSAHYVLFVNYEDFSNEITAQIERNPGEPSYFFSGYDGDSLAFDAVSGFLEYFLPFFRSKNNALFELRTKSANIDPLLLHEAIPNCIVAFSFTPERIALLVEHKTPPIIKRLNAMQRLADVGWPIGIRLDPMIYSDDFLEIYQQLLLQIFDHIKPESIHSVTYGAMRFPPTVYQRLIKLYPNDKLLAQPLYKSHDHYSYEESIEALMKKQISELLQKYFSQDILFEC